MVFVQVILERDTTDSVKTQQLDDFHTGKTTLDGPNEPTAKKFTSDLVTGKVYPSEDGEETRLVMTHAGKELTMLVR